MGSESLVLVEAAKHGGEAALALALRACPDANSSSCETTALHVAVWRNHAGIVAKLLAAGAKPDIQDGESGWTCLHKALYWGHLRIALQLIQAGASLDVPDHKGRTPLDLLAAELKPYMTGPTAPSTSGHPTAPPRSTAVFCWGSGANYQLGTGSTDFCLHPVRAEGLGQLQAVALAAAKYHSAALGADGRLWTWGWGRGGRTGHHDFAVHSGESALIRPWLVAGLGKRQVCSVAAGKHHTVVATTAGEVWTWGNGRSGRLGYGEVDTQPTPRRVAALQRVRVAAVAAAHKHSAALTVGGELYTWGANGSGQLGYGTPDSACNPSPRVVDALRGKRLVSMSLSKRHTLALTAEGEAYTWGFQAVTPRRVPLAGARDVARDAVSAAAGLGRDIRFHRGHGEVARPMGLAVAAGYLHSALLTRTGTVLAWLSADPQLRVQEVAGALTGLKVVQISATKTRVAAVTDQGDVYVWEAKEGQHDAWRAQGLGGPDPGSASLVGAASPLAAPAAGSADAGVGSPAVGSFGGGQQGGRKGGGGPRGAVPSAGPLVKPTRVPGLRRVAHVVMGEKHTMALARWSVPPLPDDAGVFPLNPATADVPGATPIGASAGPRRIGSALFSAADSDSEDDDEGLAGLLDEEVVDAAVGATAAALPASASYPDLHIAGGSSGGPTPVGSYAGGLAGVAAARVVGGGDDAGTFNDRSAGGWAGLPSLQVLAQRVVAAELVDPRNAAAVLDWADAAGAPLLRAYALATVLRNLDLVMAESGSALAALPTHLLEELEVQYRAWLQPPRRPGLGQVPRAADNATLFGLANPTPTPPLGSSPIAGSWIEAAGSRLGGADGAGPAAANAGAVHMQLLSKLQAPRRPTSVPPSLDGGVAEPTTQPPRSAALLQRDLAQPGLQPTTPPSAQSSALSGHRNGRTDGGDAAVGGAGLPPVSRSGAQGGGDEPRFQPNGQEAEAAEAAAAARLSRNVQKKLQQIALLEERLETGAGLDAQQLAKLSQKAALTDALHALESGTPVDAVQQLLTHAQDVASRLAGVPDTPATPPSTAAAGPSSAASNAASAKQLAAGPSPSSQPLAKARQRASGTPTQPSESTSAAAGLPTGTSQPQGPGGEAGDQQEVQVGPSGAASGVDAPNKPRQPSVAGKEGAKPSRRKGGLSMFLSGALEAKPPSPPPPVAAAAASAAATLVGPAPAPKAPAWGGAAAAAAPPSVPLREVLGVAAPTPRLPTKLTEKLQQPATEVPAAQLPPAGLTTPSPRPRRQKGVGAAADKQASPAAVLGLAANGGGSGGSNAHRSSGTGTTPTPLSNGARPPGDGTAAADTPVPGSGGGVGSISGSGSSGMRVSLAQFMARGAQAAALPASQPAPGAPPASTAPAAGTAWGAAPVPGSSPARSSAGLLAAPLPTLRDIQAEQERQRSTAPVWAAGVDGAASSSSSSRSAPGRTPTIAHTAALGSSPPSSKWYVPEPMHRPQAMAAIQMEEAAMREIARLYGGRATISRSAARGSGAANGK